MKSKYRVGNIFSSSEQDIIIVTDVWISKDRRQPIYKLSHITRSYYVCKTYGYYNEEELNALKYIEI